MYKKIAFTAAIVNNLFVNAQNNDDQFSKVYETSYLKIAPNNSNKALQISDSLYTYSKSTLNKAKSLMLTASIYQQRYNLKLSILNAEKAYELISTIKEPEWECRIVCFLSSQYRILGLHNKSKKYAYIGIKKAKSITNQAQNNCINGYMNLELGYSKLAEYKYYEAIQYINRSLHYFFKTQSKPNDFAISNSYQLLGDIYLSLDLLTKAELQYKKSLSLNDKKNDITSLSLAGLGEIYTKKKKFEVAKEKLTKALLIAENSQYLELQKVIYSKLIFYYSQIKDTKNEAIFSEKYIVVSNKININNQKVIDKSYADLDKKNACINKQIIIKNIEIICLVIIPFIIWFIFSKKSKRQSIIHQTKIDSLLNELNKIEKCKEKTEFTLLPETESKLLCQLEDFEKSELYNSKNMRLPFLASELNTNTKYLSFIINKHKNLDFKSYINNLRIEYIKQKLINCPKYRKYKISTLAEECGFSSHSKFATVFKLITNTSPSNFIKELEEINNK